MAKSTERTDLFRIFRAFRGLTAVFRFMDYSELSQKVCPELVEAVTRSTLGVKMVLYIVPSRMIGESVRVARANGGNGSLVPRILKIKNHRLYQQAWLTV